MRFCKGPGQSSQKIHDSDTGLKSVAFAKSTRFRPSLSPFALLKKEKDWVSVGHHQIIKE